MTFFTISIIIYINILPSTVNNWVFRYCIYYIQRMVRSHLPNIVSLPNGCVSCLFILRRKFVNKKQPILKKKKKMKIETHVSKEKCPKTLIFRKFYLNHTEVRLPKEFFYVGANAFFCLSNIILEMKMIRKSSTQNL